MKFRDVAWRTMTGFDLDQVEAIAAAVHPTLFEAPEVLAEKQRLYRDGAFLLEIGERPAGYVLSHPWMFAQPPPLNGLLGALPEVPDSYYIHDLAILPLARRIGAASQIVAALEKHARAKGLATMSLIAIAGSGGFWTRHGFAPLELPELADKLGGYGPEARMMAKALTEPRG
jgi:GNAT superfamily N-acetyltransferase